MTSLTNWWWRNQEELNNQKHIGSTVEKSPPESYNKSMKLSVQLWQEKKDHCEVSQEHTQ